MQVCGRGYHADGEQTNNQPITRVAVTDGK